MYEIRLKETGEVIESIERTITNTENQSSTLTFSVLPDSKFFNSLERFISKIEVWEDEEKAFDGWIIDISDEMSAGGVMVRKITCSSVLDFLNRTRVGKWAIHPGAKPDESEEEVNDPHIVYENMNTQKSLELILNDYNSKVDESMRIFLGNVTVIENTYFYTDRETSLNVIIDKLINRKGGYIQLREVEGKYYLDYLNELSIDDGTIELSINMKAISKKNNLKSPITRLIPIGADGLSIRSVNNDLNYVQDEILVAKYGVIEAPFEWNDVTVPSNLLAKARAKLIELNSDIYSIECSALDLSYIDESFSKFKTSQKCNIINYLLNIEDIYRIILVNINLDEPWNSYLRFSNSIYSAVNNAASDEQRLVSTEATAKRTEETVSIANKTIKTIKDDIADIKTDIVTVKKDVVVVKEDIATLKEDVATKVSLITVENKIAIAKGEANTYTDEQVTIVSNKIASVYKYIGSVVNYADLPSTGNKVGDVWNVGTTLDGINYAWSTNGWDALGLGIDLSPYYTGSQSDNKYVAKEIGKSLMLDVDKIKIDGIEEGANKYIHPSTHSPGIILQDINNRFVTDTEKASWSNKVDKVAGKGLSTEDYTTIEKNKLSGIESNAEVNNISDINATDLTDSTDTTLHYHATDRNRANHSGTQLASTISDFVATVRATILTGLSTTTNAVISATDTVLGALGKLQKQVSDNLTTLTSHTGSVSNPHNVTKTQVGLSNVDNTSDVLKPISTLQQSALDNKVDDNQVLTNVPSGAVFTDTITTINGKTGVIVKADIVALGIPTQDTTYGVFTPTINGLTPLSGGGTTKYLRADGTWVVPPDTNTTYGVATTSANGLLSSADKTKLDGVATGANNYMHPAGTNPHGTTKSDVGLSNADNTSDLSKPISTAAQTALNLKVDKVTGKSLLLDSEITRLSGMVTGANNYTHPTTHPPAIIAQDSSNRFVSDTEKSTWNGKATQANIDNAIATLKQNGATRPTTNLFVGMVFFDTKLGKPIWCKTISPIVWIDSTGRNADAIPGLYIN